MRVPRKHYSQNIKATETSHREHYFQGLRQVPWKPQIPTLYFLFMSFFNSFSPPPPIYIPQALEHLIYLYGVYMQVQSYKTLILKRAPEVYNEVSNCIPHQFYDLEQIILILDLLFTQEGALVMSDSQRGVPGSATSASFVNVTEMQILRSHPDLWSQKLCGWAQQSS